MTFTKILVTGGAGFLGSHFIRSALDGSTQLLNVDALTYAGDLARLDDVAADPNYRFSNTDIRDGSSINEVVGEYAPEAIVHYAAETHVTRSETDPAGFYRTNVEGTRNLLESALAAGVGRFVHISTDEVYGSILEGSFKEGDKEHGKGSATSAYAESKALADDLVLSYSDRIDVVVARPTNAFGPWQFPEKAFPRWVTRALRGEPILVWGDGLYVRQWLFAEDFAAAIGILLEDGAPGQAYNVGPEHQPEITNLNLAKWLVGYLGLDEDRIQMTAYDRPDHDRRYAVYPGKIQELGWEPGDVWQQFADTVDWYRDNQQWWMSHVAEAESIYTDSLPS